MDLSASSGSSVLVVAARKAVGTWAAGRRFCGSTTRVARLALMFGCDRRGERDLPTDFFTKDPNAPISYPSPVISYLVRSAIQPIVRPAQ